ncbi:hypothetical protein MAPG_10329 [Magnaporthiopsis poae ATCC 64411]|uniref:Uncharacterized protein n=1 Tax=Magnaporthiopsis poae (strain ATCC 64411 / 73-15) TaxID=644358 RepID=A0A0C4ECB4_MAGP6|nr:hypothetical protein MAPG_10329 [Magnaporthiopsis poae ATCC 64411]
MSVSSLVDQNCSCCRACWDYIPRRNWGLPLDWQGWLAQGSFSTSPPCWHQEAKASAAASTCSLAHARRRLPRPGCRHLACWAVGLWDIVCASLLRPDGQPPQAAVPLEAATIKRKKKEIGRRHRLANRAIFAALIPQKSSPAWRTDRPRMNRARAFGSWDRLLWRLRRFPSPPLEPFAPCQSRVVPCPLPSALAYAVFFSLWKVGAKRTAIRDR